MSNIGNFEYSEIRKQAAQAALELCELANLQRGNIVVVGCSTSEVVGGVIGQNSSLDIAAEIYSGLMESFDSYGVYIAAQCCEHLNRAIAIDRTAVAPALALSHLGNPTFYEVNAIPRLKAGGAFAEVAYMSAHEPTLLSGIAADAGLDIGGTLIGMHLKHVAVPVRLSISKIGCANLCAARTRIPFTGGERAIYK